MSMRSRRWIQESIHRLLSCCMRRLAGAAGEAAGVNRLDQRGIGGGALHDAEQLLRGRAGGQVGQAAAQDGGGAQFFRA